MCVCVCVNVFVGCGGECAWCVLIVLVCDCGLCGVVCVDECVVCVFVNACLQALQPHEYKYTYKYKYKYKKIYIYIYIYIYINLNIYSCVQVQRSLNAGFTCLCIVTCEITAKLMLNEC
jgi:hypothetical protein